MGNSTTRRILDILKRIDFMFPGSVRHVRVRDHKMKVFLDNVHEDTVDYLTDEKLFTGMYVETQKYMDDYYEVTFHFNLMEISDHLCGHLETRKCWGMTRIHDWISELEYYLGDINELPKPRSTTWWGG